jgi:hypothetical protein
VIKIIKPAGPSTMSFQAAANLPTHVWIEGMKRSARELLESIDECGISIEDEFRAALELLSKDPVRAEVRVAMLACDSDGGECD